MRHADLRPCAGCGLGVCRDGSSFFYRAVVTQQIIDSGAVQRATGMEMMMGGHIALARIMDGDPHFTAEMPETVLLVCFPCYVSKPLAELIEAATEAAERESS